MLNQITTEAVKEAEKSKAEAESEEIRKAQEEADKLRTKAESDAETQAQLLNLLKEDAAAAYLYGASTNSPLRSMPFAVFRTYVKDMHTEILGEHKANPILRFLIDNFLSLFHMANRCSVEISISTNQEEIRSKGALIIQAIGEQRRLYETIRTELTRAGTKAATKATPSETMVPQSEMTSKD